jgi:hypothetical protein
MKKNFKHLKWAKWYGAGIKKKSSCRSLENRFLFKWKKKKKKRFPHWAATLQAAIDWCHGQKVLFKKERPFGGYIRLYAHGIILKYGFHDIYLVVEMGQKYRLLDQRNQWEEEEEEEEREAMANYWISITI